jgi:hypothetical protein
MSRYTDGTHDDFIAAVTPLLPPVCEGDTVPLSKRFVESEEGDWIDLAKPTGDVINGEPQYHFAAEDDLLAVGINPDGDELSPDDIRARAWERYTGDAGKLGGCFTAFDAAARYIIDAVRAQQKDAQTVSRSEAMERGTQAGLEAAWEATNACGGYDFFMNGEGGRIAVATVDAALTAALESPIGVPEDVREAAKRMRERVKGATSYSHKWMDSVPVERIRTILDWVEAQR